MKQSTDIKITDTEMILEKARKVFPDAYANGTCTKYAGKALIRTEVFNDAGDLIRDYKPEIVDFFGQVRAYCEENISSFLRGEVVDAFTRIGDGSAKKASDGGARFGTVDFINLADAFQNHIVGSVPLGTKWAKILIGAYLLRSPMPFVVDGVEARYENHEVLFGMKRGESGFEILERNVLRSFKRMFPGQSCSFKIDHHAHVTGNLAENAKKRTFFVVLTPGGCEETAAESASKPASKPASKGGASGPARGAGSR